MRALTWDEVAVLRGDYKADVHDKGSAVIEICERLLMCRRVRKTFTEDGRFRYHITPLGRLALRVSLPTPPVLP